MLFKEREVMPAVKKVSREEIIDAAVDVLRDGGFSSVNARSVAKKLGCSTQPIYFSFKNMDELKIRADRTGDSDAYKTGQRLFAGS